MPMPTPGLLRDAVRAALGSEPVHGPQHGTGQTRRAAFRRAHRSPWTMLGLAFALCGAAAALSLVSHEAGANLEPRPDALEYAVLAYRLADGDPPTLPIGDRTYPSRYPLGFPLLLVPAAAAGVPPDLLWVVPAVIALVGIAAVYEAARRATNVAVATWAALLLAASPGFVQFGVMTMSDGPATVATAVWAVSLVRRVGTPLLGAVAGYAGTIRLTALPLLLAGALAATARGRPALRGFLVGALIGFAPSLLAYALGWSGALAGYAFWVPDRYAHGGAAFAAHHLAENVAHYGPAILGVGRRPPFYPVAVPALAVLGLWTVRRSPRRVEFMCLAAVLVLQVGIVLPYFFRTVRLLLPAVPLVLLLAAIGLANVSGRWRPLAWAVAIAALAVQIHGTQRLLHGDRRESRMNAVMGSLARVLPEHGVIVSDVPALLAWLYWIRGTDREFMPLVVPPAGPRHDFVDRHVRALYATGAHGAGALPHVLLDGAAATPTGVAVARRRANGSPVVLIACTEYGKQLLPRAIEAVAAVPEPKVGRCDVAAVR